MATATSARNDSGRSTCDFRQIALEELRETDQIKEQSLSLMIDWIKKHPHIKKCRTDAPFLLRFLRTKKFSVPLACEMLERFLTIRQLYPHWFQNLDCNDPELKKLLKDGYLVPLPQRDHGKIILFCSAKYFNPQKFTSCHMVRVHSLVTETLADDEFNQIAGYCYVNDESGLSLDHLALWSLTEIKNIMKCIQHSSPMRHKETHFLFLPSYSAKILEYAFGFLSNKLQNRIKIHPKLENLYDCLDKSILPAEYGGLIPIKDMIEQFQLKLAEKRSSVLALDDMYIELKNNQSKFLKDIQHELGTGVEGSFKKLEID